ncbi:Synaptonemal complex protein 2 [Apostasia shenzhenica]|uniref:Synaptonemal complex protein 2 n=1 Tax=Apostasia shenzhenica TaxID=1088818 RepID=A0A2I0ACD5_9ASPA|nr:Synaptonemal complex protein 2 [Apostasia shenzhenica]
MKKLGISGLKSFDQLRSLTGSLAGTTKATAATARSSVDSLSHGSFTNLKLAAEKLVKEQASVKTDLELSHAKLRKATEQIHVLEAKLQEAVNENAKLRVKQAEDTKLWKALDIKFSSTKELCDQLCDTVHHLACQTRAAEDDKKLIEAKIFESTKAFDNFNLQLNELSIKLQNAENAIKVGNEEMLKLRQEKDEAESCFKHERCAIDEVIKGKDSVIEQLEEAIEQHKKRLETLDSQLCSLQHELISKEVICKNLSTINEKLEEECSIVQSNNQELKQQIERAFLDIKKFEGVILKFMTIIAQLDNEHSSISEHVAKLISSFDKYYDLLHQKHDLSAKHIQGKINELQQQLLNTMEQTSSFKVHNEHLNYKIVEMQKAEEYIMVQHADECRIAEDKIRKLESEIEVHLSRKNELEKLAIELEEKVQHLTQASRQAEDQMQQQCQKIHKLESDNQDLELNRKKILQEKVEETTALHNEISKYEQHAGLLGNETNELRAAVDVKEKLLISFREKEKHLEEQKSEIQASLIASECRLSEAKKQYDMMFENKQLELSKHLKELSQKNDQAINEIRKKYEAEKEEIANMERQKANQLIKEIEANCNKKIEQHKEAAEKLMLHVKEDHNAISKIQQENDQKEVHLRANHREEFQRLQLQAENELRERTSSLRKEHEIQIKSLKMQHEDELRKLQEDLELQKSREEKQRKLLQLQWKVMSENQHDDQEVSSKKEYSVSSIKMRDPYNMKGCEVVLPTPESERKEMNLSGYMRTPMGNLLKKVGGKAVPKHRKITRHEYEVETSNGRTVTKRKKTKSTVMFGVIIHLSKDKTSLLFIFFMQLVGGTGPNPANIGDLFSEGCLNPYVDDPYAFG